MTFAWSLGVQLMSDQEVRSADRAVAVCSLLGMTFCCWNAFSMAG